MVDFANILKRLRTEEGMTQQQLAAKLGVTKSVVSYYELQARTPSPEILVKLSRIFHVSADYLLGLETKEALFLDGLSDEDIAMIRRLVATLRKNSKGGDA